MHCRSYCVKGLVFVLPYFILEWPSQKKYSEIKNEFIKSSYSESAITAILNHSSVKNNTARQIFLDDETRDVAT